MRREHEARRSWKSQEQKNIVIAELDEKSDEWVAMQERIQTEANRKRSEAAKAQPRTDTGFAEKQVVPQIEGAPDRTRGTAAAKAKATGTNRAAVERAEFIRRKDPELAAKVGAGDIPERSCISRTPGH